MGNEGYLEHEWVAKTLHRLEMIVNATSSEHKAAGKVLKNSSRMTFVKKRIMFGAMLKNISQTMIESR